MKQNLFTQLTFVAALAFGSVAFAHDDATLDRMQAPHNGQLRMSGIHHFELVLAKDSNGSKDDPVAVYLTDHAGTKIPSAGVVGTATILTGKSKIVVPLAAAGDNKLTGSGYYAYDPQTKVVVSLTFADKITEQARFTPATGVPADERTHADVGHTH